VEFPEVIFGNHEAYLHVQEEIADFFSGHEEGLSAAVSAGRHIRAAYKGLEHFFTDFTGPVCMKCQNPCCVNRHGFPDYEDIVVFNAMGIKPPNFNCSTVDTEPCQFLSETGCILPRFRRSYRCTWYFCDYCMDKFQAQEETEFKKFEILMQDLSRNRIILLEQFEREWLHFRPPVTNFSRK